MEHLSFTQLKAQRSGFEFFSNRSPATRVRFEEEEGGCGYGAFAALTETAEAELSRLLQTTPCAIIASATFRKPATFAPSIRLPGWPHSTDAS